MVTASGAGNDEAKKTIDRSIDEKSDGIVVNEEEPTSNGEAKVHDLQVKGGLEFNSERLRTSSTYNIYYRKDGKAHFLITPISSPDRDKVLRGKKDPDTFDAFKDALPKAAEENSYFIHQPCLFGKDPPRTLRRGARKTSPTVALINNSFLWRKWRIEFGEGLKDAVDPRGVVSARHACTHTRQMRGGFKQPLGFKVPSYREWGNSGKAYHDRVNEERKAGTLAEDPDTFVHPQSALVDEVVYFSWHSPFTHKTRIYEFKYAGLDFYWKGTGTVKESRTCGWWLRFHHLKLCARIPLDPTDSKAKAAGPIRRTTTLGSFFKSKSGGFREICIAKYTSSLARKKAGVLQIYDDEIYRMTMDDIIRLDKEKKRVLEEAGAIGVKELRLYDVIVASAMCMVIGEWQKREALLALLMLAAEGGDGGGG